MMELTAKLMAVNQRAWHLLGAGMVDAGIDRTLPVQLQAIRQRITALEQEEESRSRQQVMAISAPDHGGPSRWPTRRPGS
jgi:hypothetical protein